MLAPGDAAPVRPVLFALAVALAVGVFWVAATTYPAPTDFVDVPNNHVRTGALHLDLSGGAAGTELSVPGLLPGARHEQRIWLAANDPRSATSGVLTLQLDAVRDVAGPCSTSRDKALAEQASGIDGCTVRGTRVTGRPGRGSLSRLLSLEVRSAVAGAAAGCDSAGDVVVRGTPGNIRSLAGRSLALGSDATRGELVLAPGRGACLTVEIGWPPDVTDAADADRDHPLDNAAQGDGLQLHAVFTLTQVAP